MHKLAILASGNGSNFQAVINAIKKHSIKNAQITCLIVSNDRAYVIERAKKNNIPYYIVSKKNTRHPSDEILKILKKNKIDFVILAGYLGILKGQILNKYKNKIINIHPALLPKYGGKGMYGHYVHEAVIASKEKVSGATVHFVSNEIDKGKIILQQKISISKSETPISLAKKVLKQEHILIVKGIKKITS